MATAQEIPLQPSQNQFLQTTLNGITFGLQVTWRDATNNPGWVLDLFDSNDNPLVRGMPLVTGADLMEQHQADVPGGFPGQLWVQSDFDPQAIPTFDNLGVTSHLYFIVP
jgi:hypothetical protein